MLTVPEAAKLMGVSPKLVYELVAQRRIAHFRVGLGRGKVLLHPDDVQAYLQSCRVHPQQRAEARKPRRFRSRFFD